MVGCLADVVFGESVFGAEEDGSGGCEDEVAFGEEVFLEGPGSAVPAGFLDGFVEPGLCFDEG